MFKILSTYICWKKYIKCNIWRVSVRLSYIKDARFLKVKYINNIMHKMFYLSMAFQIYSTRIISGCVLKSVWHTKLDTV
jgi:capsule polysaccharide modification protein KpsS